MDLGARGLDFSAGALPVEFGNIALLVTGSINSERFLTGTQRALCRLKLHIDGQQGKVALGDLSGRRKFKSLMAQHSLHEDIGKGGISVPGLAPEVELPARRQFALIIGGPAGKAAAVKGHGIGAFFRSALSRSLAFAVHGRPDGRGSHAGLGRGGLNLGHGLGEILILLQGLGHELVEDRVIEPLPPVGVQGLIAELHVLPGGRKLLIGTFIFGSQGTGRQHGGHAQKGSESKEDAHVTYRPPLPHCPFLRWDPSCL